MLIGIPREVKNNEFRVAITPAGVHELVDRGHRVLIEASAGVGSAVSDDDYRVVGAEVVATADDAWAADLVLKVKEPVPEERHLLREDQTLFTYLHLAADRSLVGALLAVGISLSGVATGFGFVALILASVNIFGGFLVTQRMLAMYKKKEK